MTTGQKKTGGRQKGTPNKATQDIINKLEAANCDPILGMVDVAKEAMVNGDYKTAGAMYKELAPYIAPKRKSIEIDMETTVVHEVEIMTDDELLSELAELGIDGTEH